MTNKQIVELPAEPSWRPFRIDHIRVDRRKIIREDTPIIASFIFGILFGYLIVCLTLMGEKLIKYIF